LLYRAYRDVYLPPHHADFKTISDSESLPIARRLAEQGFHWNWHEYGRYITWLGMGLALCGIVAAWKTQWPMYVAGGLTLLVVMGQGSPVNVYSWLQQLPFYASMHVPSRFLAFVLFTLAIAAGHGLDWLCRRVEGTRFPILATALAWLIPTVIVAELTVQDWKLFDDTFVCKPRANPPVNRQEFATRVQTTAHWDPRMMSCLYPFLKSNTGVLEGYENLRVPRGRIILEGKPGYRGESFLEAGTGRAEIVDWTMNRVKVAVSVDSADRVVLNQNYDSGWRACVSGSRGVHRGNASSSSEGLISISVQPGDSEVEFYYLPGSFVWGAWTSGLSLLVCGVFWMVPPSCFRRTSSPPTESIASEGVPHA
jgi:hypothetical protein